jgi:GT2 family glycosyltransferase
MGAEWVFYLDDDHIHTPPILNSLLAREKDVIGPLYLQREWPFAPIVYDRENPDGAVYQRLLRPFDSGLISVKAIGAGGLLVRRKVFETLEKPWWRLGQVRSDLWGDDIDFCRRVRQAGFEVWCDLDNKMGHITTAEIWPVKDEKGNWLTTIVIAGKAIVTLPAAHHVLDPGQGLVK